jgi:hypothetical protein
MDHPVAFLRDQVRRMGGQHQDAGTGNHVLHPLLRLVRELGVAHRQPLVHQQYVGLDAGRDRERQPHQHAGGVGAHRHVDVLAQAAELADLGRESVDLLLAHAHHQAAQHDVLDASGIRLDAKRRVDQAGHGALAHEFARGGLVHPGKGAQQRRLARSVVANQAEAIATLELECDVAERLHHVDAGFLAEAPAGDRRRKRLLEGRRPGAIDGEVDRDVFEGDE